MKNTPKVASKTMNDLAHARQKIGKTIRLGKLKSRLRPVGVRRLFEGDQAT